MMKCIIQIGCLGTINWVNRHECGDDEMNNTNRLLKYDDEMNNTNKLLKYSKAK